MRKKNLWKIGMLLCVCLILALANPENAIWADELDENIIIEDDDPYVNIVTAYCSLLISSGTANVDSVIEGKNGTTSTSVTVHLEKLVNGSWQQYTSWNHNGGKDQNNQDSTTVSHGVYRVWMSVTAVGADGSESFNVDGNTVGY